MLQNCIAVILAGGKSQRMGQPKGLLLYKDHFWLLEHIKRLKSAGIKEFVIALGFDAELYYRAIPVLEKALDKRVAFEDINMTVVFNDTPQLGSFSTLKKALKIIDEPSDILVCLIDVPILNATELKKIISTKSSVVKPTFKGKSGHPIKIDCQFVKKLLNENSSNRLDRIIENQAGVCVKKLICSDRQITLNLNTPENWLKYLNDIFLQHNYK